MRMRTHVEPLARRQLRWPHLVEEHERPDHPAFDRRQGAAHRKSGDILGFGVDDQKGFHGQDVGSCHRLDKVDSYPQVIPLISR